MTVSVIRKSHYKYFKTLKYLWRDKDESMEKNQSTPLLLTWRHDMNEGRYLDTSTGDDQLISDH